MKDNPALAVAAAIPAPSFGAEEALQPRHGGLVRAALSLLLGLALHGTALAQTPDAAGGAQQDTVSWTVSVQPADTVKPGGALSLALHGTVLDGWHVYSLQQLPNGPTPLRITLDTGDIAAGDGAPVGSPPVKARDQAFGFETQYYAGAFTVTVPVRLQPHLAGGRQAIPFNVRFQTCNGRVCQPPKAVHLSAPITVTAGG